MAQKAESSPTKTESVSLATAPFEVAPNLLDWPQQLATLRVLAQIVKEEKLSELEVEHDGVQMILKAPSSRRSSEILAPLADDIEYSMEENAPPVPAAKAEKAASGTPIVSPMVGLFYRAPSPSDAPFVEIGDKIEVGQTVGLVETMKVFNEITSEIEGTVLEIRALKGALVETGDVLMVIG